MAETPFPGVFRFEEEATPVAVPAAVGTGGQIGLARKGPTDRPGFVTSWTEFQALYGSYYQQNYLAHTVRGFFDNVGARTYIGRVLGAGSATATGTFADVGGNNVITPSALFPGAWGNDISMSTLKHSALSTVTVGTGAVSVDVDVLVGFEIGDVVKIDDGTTDILVTVKTIDIALKRLGFLDVGTITTIASGAVVKTYSRHIAQTITAADLANTETSVELVSTTGISVGSALTIQGATEDEDVLVTNVSGNVVSFAAVALGSVLAAGSTVSSQEFALTVQELALDPESIIDLTMQATHLKNSIATKLAGNGNQSKLISAVAIASASALREQIPAIDAGVIAGGLDGSAPTDAEVKGDATPGSKTGIYLFDALKDIRMVSTPGFTSADVTGHGVDVCDTRRDCVYIAETPLVDDQAQEALTYRVLTLGKASSYGALYWPWVQLKDPETDVLIDIPPSGHIQGIWASTAASRGTHKAPANVAIKGVLGLTHEPTDGDHTLLNPKGVNVIRIDNGVRVMGARTLWPTIDGKHYINIRNFLIETGVTLADAFKFAVFEPNNSTLWTKMDNIATNYLHGKFTSGALQPLDDESKAYFVKVDGELNTQTVISKGQVVILVGVNPVPPAEFVVFRITLWDGGRSIEELAQAA